MPKHEKTETRKVELPTQTVGSQKLKVDVPLETEGGMVSPIIPFEMKYAPSTFITQLSNLHNRLMKILEKETSKSLENQIRHTVELLDLFAGKLDKSFAPVPPKKLQDAYDWALSRNHEGTYIALIDEAGNLIKTLTVDKSKMLSEMPKITTIDRDTVVTMSGRYLLIEGLTMDTPDGDKPFEKAIPKRVSKTIAFSSNKEKIFSYEA